jgi:hypothetical protein
MGGENQNGPYWQSGPPAVGMNGDTKPERAETFPRSHSWSAALQPEPQLP